MPRVSPFTVALVVAALACAAVAALAWRRREKPAATTLGALMGAALLWIATSLLAIAAYSHGLGVPFVDVAASRADAWLFWQRAGYVGITATVAAWVLFTAEYTGREWVSDPRVLAALAVEPVVVTALLWSNPVHGLVWAEVALSSPSGGIAIAAHGPFFWVHAVYSYVLTLAGAYFLVRMLYRRGSVYRGQAVAVVPAVVAPLLGNAVYLADLSPVDLTPVGFTVSGVAFAYAIFRYELVDLAPVARDTVVANIGDGVVVLDAEDRVVDINPAARRILGLDGETVIGEDARTAFSAFPTLVDRYAGVPRATEEISIDTDDGRRHFELRVSPLSGAGGRQLGRLFLIHDVTAQVDRQRELERRNEQLDRFASLVSHDLRNPLNVAGGYLEAARSVAGEDVDAHLREVERSHERMERLIEDVLTLAREDEDAPDPERVALGDLARTAWDQVATPEASLDVTVAATVRADPDRLLRLFENCYRNSVEHGGPGVTVRVGPIHTEPPRPGTDPEAGSGTTGPAVGPAPDPGSGLRGFYVEDDGPGFPETDRERVLEDGYTTAEEGTGLGLSIVRSVAQAHGWELTVTEAANGGARLEVLGVEPVESDARTGESTTG